MIGFEAPYKLLQSLGILVDSKDFCRWVDVNIPPVLENINTNYIFWSCAVAAV